MAKRSHTRNVTVDEAELQPVYLPRYENSWAIVIGINNYEHVVPNLSLANRDAAGMAELLVTRLAFPKENVFVVLDPPVKNGSLSFEVFSKRATKQVIEELVFNRLPSVAGVNDRIVFFYAGHGVRRLLPHARLDDVGYLAPSDAKPDQWNTFIEWEAIMRAGDYCPAKHVFYLLDACYSGIAASRGNVTPTRFTDDMLSARVRQILTAGTAKQAVTDVGPQGHSLFTSYVLEGLKGAAAMFDPGIITASELMIYVRNRVAPDKTSKQTPAFSMLDSEPGGDFIFIAPAPQKPASDLSRYVRIRDQGQHGVPASYAMVTALETSLRRQGTPARLSPDKLVELGQRLDGTRLDEGEYLKTIVNAAESFGVPVSKVERVHASIRANQTGATPIGDVPIATCNARCQKVKTFEEIPDQLALGRPVITGISWYTSFDKIKHGALPLVQTKDQLIGGHCITIVGFDPASQVYRFANSWGTAWGDQGFGTIDAKALSACIDAQAMWSVEALLFVWSAARAAGSGR